MRTTSFLLVLTLLTAGSTGASASQPDRPNAPAPAAAPAAPAPPWTDPAAVVAIDALGPLTVESVLRGRVIRGDGHDPMGSFATMVIKALRERVVDQTLAASAECPPGQIEPLANLIAVFRNMRTKVVEEALADDKQILTQWLAELETPNAAPRPNAGDDPLAARAAYLRGALPTADAVRERLRVIETARPEVAMFGEEARTLCRRILAAEELSGAPVRATPTDLAVYGEELVREKQLLGDRSPIVMPRDVELRVRLQKADSIVRAELARRIDAGEITILHPELAAPARSAADPMNPIGWL